MKKIKKNLWIIMVTLMAIAMVACKGDEKKVEPEKNQKEESKTTDSDKKNKEDDKDKSKPDDKKDKTSDDDKKDNDDKKDDDSVKVTKTTSNDSEVYEINKEMEVDDVKFNLLKIIESKGEGSAKPKKGEVFLLPVFKVTNDKDEEIVVSSIMHFKIYADGKQVKNSYIALTLFEDIKQLDTKIEAKKIFEGKLGISVPENWKELKIEIKPDLLDDDKVEFVYNKK
ncbi:MAG: DUF5067 domain-containing protein [Tissierellia bacterium]|nr:DUF5067 domain-containing protein [Tissierellia bacterium]